MIGNTILVKYKDDKKFRVIDKYVFAVPYNHGSMGKPDGYVGETRYLCVEIGTTEVVHIKPRNVIKIL
jgi:hypothetical protein